MNLVNRALLCRKIESLFDSTPCVEKLDVGFPVYFYYTDTIQDHGDLDIMIISGPAYEMDIVYYLSQWLKGKKISHQKVYSEHAVISIHHDSLDRFIDLIEPFEFDHLWDLVSDRVNLINSLKLTEDTF